MGLFSKWSKSELKQWQDLILADYSPKLIMTEKQLKKTTLLQAQNDIRIIQDSAKLIDSTTNVETFFSRFELLNKHVEHLIMLEPYLSFSGERPSQMAVTLINNRDQAVQDFVIRYFTSIMNKAEEMKTDSGKKRQYQKFYDSLQPYYPKMNQWCMDYIETKYKAYSQ